MECYYQPRYTAVDKYFPRDLSDQAMAYFNPWMFGFARPPPQRGARLWKPGEDFLQNTFHFPSFRDLPHENEIEEGYWKCDDTGVFVPACTWFFMAEITYDECSQIPFLRNRVAVRDRVGHEEIPIYFYPEEGFFDFKTLKKGSTILVANGQKHNFLDLSIGLRIEQLDTVSVAPCSMGDLFSLSQTYHENKGTKCWACGETSVVAGSSSEAASSSVEELKKCGACKVACYCCKECQTKHWKERHKRSCKAMPIFTKLTKIDYTKHDTTAFLGPAHFIPGLLR